MLAALRDEDQDNIYVQKAEQVYQAIAADSTLDRMTALDRCARMAELSLQAMGASKNTIAEYFRRGAGLLWGV